MKKLILLLTIIIGSICLSDFEVVSSGIKNGIIEEQYGGKGKTIKDVGITSLPLEWKDIPEGTKSFAIIMMDYDSIPVVGVPWVHWTVANISANKTKLTKNESRINKDLIQGVNSWISPIGGFTKEEASFYGAPMPPDKDHVYIIKMYALDTVLDLEQGYYANELYKMMEGHILETATLEGIYKK